MKASQPSTLRFGVVEQSHVPSRLQPTFANQVRYIHVHSNFSRGVCWARGLAFGLYQNEDFLLQIDSHMLFAPSWDRVLIAWLDHLSLSEPRAVISSYPFAFEEVNGRVVVSATSGQTLVMRPKLDSNFGEGSPLLVFEGIPVSSNKPVIGCHLAAGCMFTRGTFVDSVPYDTRLYFHGEEQNLAIRAWTQGWNFFHVPDLPIFHLYKKPDLTAKVHWNAMDDAARSFRFADLSARSLDRMQNLLVRGQDLGRYGLGTARSLKDFANFSGIDYPNLQLKRIPAEEPLPAETYNSP
jgi:hypothetical protein